METLQQCKEEIAKREKERHKDEMKIFYPDPMEENNCAQCGKPKEKHRKDVSDRPFFCNEMVPKKSFSELSDEAAELFAQSKSQPLEERIKELEEQVEYHAGLSLKNANTVREFQVRVQQLEDELADLQATYDQ